MALRIIHIRVKPPEAKEGFRVAKIYDVPKGLKGRVPAVEFWNSLFFWGALLYAFKYYIDVERNSLKGHTGPKPKNVLINNRLLDLNSIEVVSQPFLEDGTHLALRVEGDLVGRGQVHLAGLVFEIDGELILDLTQDHYTTIEKLAGKIIVSSEEIEEEEE